MADFRGQILRVLAHIKDNRADFYKNPRKYVDSINEIITRSGKSEAGFVLSDGADTKALDNLLMELSLIAQEANNPEEFKTIDIRSLSGIGKKAFEALDKQSITTVEDMIYHLPYRYEFIGDSQNGKKAMTGVFQSGSIVVTKNRKRLYKAVFNADFGQFAAVWFHFNNKFPSGSLKEGEKYTIFGQSGSFGGMESIVHPQFMKESDLGEIIPVYSLPKQVVPKIWYNALKEALNKYLNLVPDYLPARLEMKYGYPTARESLMTIHVPRTAIELSSLTERRHPACQRLIYEELLYLQMGLLYKKKTYARQQGVCFEIKKEYLDWIKTLLPFKFTSAQKKVMAEIFNDMASNGQMNRLVQGDVGSGKTIVAFTAGLTAVKNGYQVAVIAPTEVLARQHMVNLVNLIQGTNVTAALLTGSMTASEKRRTKEMIAAGHIDFVVGTHAVIQEDADFMRLGLAIIDEQHRFGVEQRKTLIEKGYMPDILLMTATPIPRTLALSFYGDLDISIIDEMPPGRTPILTKYTSRIEEAHKLIESEIQKGHGAYVIYPLIDISEKLDLKAASDEYEHLCGIFGEANVGLLHGRMKQEQKQDLMDRFKSGNIKILVSTTVVEVGVDVPHATVMVIENAERFGLSQLHQLRGRVGRSHRQSYCMLVTGQEVSEDARERISAMCKYADGFRLSEIDLDMRGPGDFFGTRQSGLPEFRFSNIVRDVKVLQTAREDAQEILAEDPELSMPKNAVIRQVLAKRWKKELEYIDIA